MAPLALLVVVFALAVSLGVATMVVSSNYIYPDAEYAPHWGTIFPALATAAQFVVLEGG
jgi:hypothetical protein